MVQRELNLFHEGTENQVHTVYEFSLFSIYFFIKKKKGTTTVTVESVFLSCLSLMKDAKCEYFYYVYEWLCLFCEKTVSNQFCFKNE